LQVLRTSPSHLLHSRGFSWIWKTNLDTNNACRQQSHRYSVCTDMEESEIQRRVILHETCVPSNSSGDDIRCGRLGHGSCTRPATLCCRNLR
ncbi:hypothetical protein PMAYCL1PPCAC_09780, partial [Pristionchus mayeri]